MKITMKQNAVMKTRKKVRKINRININFTFDAYFSREYYALL